MTAMNTPESILSAPLSNEPELGLVPLRGQGNSPTETPSGPPSQRSSFGMLVELLRRHEGWHPEELAFESNQDPAVILQIEENVNYRPAPSTVVQIAKVFHLPTLPLFQMAGLTDAKPALCKSKVALGFRPSEHVGKLSQDERLLLEDCLLSLKSPSLRRAA